MIYTEDQLVKVNGVILPGVLKSIEVTETAKIDEQEVEGSATKPKQATGYQDATVKIELILDDTAVKTKYQMLAEIRAVFRADGQAVPQPISIVSEDTAAHGVSTVLFKGLTHKAENKSGQLPVTLDFVEYVPQTIQTIKQSSKQSSGSSASSGDQTPSSAGAGEELAEEYRDYLATKRGLSPAVDDDSPAEEKARIAAAAA